MRAAELGSFAAAAKRLDVSAASLGQAVKRLEDGFGVRLLNRTTRKMSLTPEGRLLYDRCRGPLAALEDVAGIFDESRGIVAGPLRLSAPLGFGRRHVMPLIARFMEDHPAVSVTLDASDVVRDFVDDPVDIAFRILRPRDSAIIARPISRLQAVTVASPDYLRRSGMPRRPGDIDDHACISYRHPATGELAPWSFRVGGRDTILMPSSRFLANDVEACCEAAALGIGLAQPPSNYAAPYLESGRLVSLLDRFRTTPWTIYLCFAGRRKLPLRVRAFIEFARRELGRERFVMGA